MSQERESLLDISDEAAAELFEQLNEGEAVDLSGTEYRLIPESEYRRLLSYDALFGDVERAESLKSHACEVENQANAIDNLGDDNQPVCRMCGVADAFEREQHAGWCPIPGLVKALSALPKP